MPVQTQGDPRRPQDVKPFYISPAMVEQSTDGLTEIYNLVGLIAALVGIMFRFRYASWLSLFASLLGTVHERKITEDPNKRPTMSSITFALMGLGTAYLPYAVKIYQGL
ncbi:hypothetical protein H4R33_007006 [Dimargaris cristalligena]|uniref:Protein Asterix n=1 Tax=Dimargaris cristalligena TaxID=215637 RepID=A0A4P9ZKY0_9FUNG|nr:hypothetical protein H4R33_007006 [Dimargaris cristalligena]RKP33917.1 hypothetical protein BJ085DRAFT_39941 [Dimargaris cristalligena]|eukprot:RKP33917.1 hypothetical protein BJ085DRAFT_39941 [Dimargaris cristalligena]